MVGMVMVAPEETGHHQLLKMNKGFEEHVQQLHSDALSNIKDMKQLLLDIEMRGGADGDDHDPDNDSNYKK